MGPLAQFASRHHLQLDFQMGHPSGKVQVMPNEYNDPVHPSAIETAVSLGIKLRACHRQMSVEESARRAVDAVFCTCVTSAADAVANSEAPVHTALINEIRQQMEKRVVHSAPDAIGDMIDRASDQSFPASDPPAWIWR